MNGNAERRRNTVYGRINMKKFNVETLKINVENLNDAFDRSESLWFSQDFEDDVNNVIFKAETPKLAFLVENIDEFKKITCTAITN